MCVSPPCDRWQYRLLTTQWRFNAPLVGRYDLDSHKISVRQHSAAVSCLVWNIAECMPTNRSHNRPMSSRYKVASGNAAFGTVWHRSPLLLCSVTRLLKRPKIGSNGWGTADGAGLQQGSDPSLIATDLPVPHQATAETPVFGGSVRRERSPQPRVMI